MSPTKKPRAKGVKLQPWFIERVRKIADDRKRDLHESLGELARLLSEAVDRHPAWDHGAVSRFLDEKVTTAPMAEAFAILFKLPQMTYTPRSYEEAVSMQQVSARYDRERPNPDQRRRMDAFDHALELADVEIEGQTRTVRSKDEGAARSRRPGRAARSGS